MVTEADNHRVSVLSAGSAFRLAFGKDVVPDNGATGFEECRADGAKLRPWRRGEVVDLGSPR
jgi:hypothetical protein